MYKLKVEIKEHNHIPEGSVWRYKAKLSEYIEGKKELITERSTFLEIVNPKGEVGFYLNRFNEKGECITDTWHEDLDDALHQAKFEFGVPYGDWKIEEIEDK